MTARNERIVTWLYRYEANIREIINYFQIKVHIYEFVCKIKIVVWNEYAINIIFLFFFVFADIAYDLIIRTGHVIECCDVLMLSWLHIECLCHTAEPDLSPIAIRSPCRAHSSRGRICFRWFVNAYCWVPTFTLVDLEGVAASPFLEQTFF